MSLERIAGALTPSTFSLGSASNDLPAFPYPKSVPRPRLQNRELAPYGVLVRAQAHGNLSKDLEELPSKGECDYSSSPRTPVIAFALTSASADVLRNATEGKSCSKDFVGFIFPYLIPCLWGRTLSD